MNRMNTLAEPLTSNSSQDQICYPSPQNSNLARDFHYSVFTPLHYEPNYAYPLLIWLHGPQANERQVQQIMPHVSLRNFVSIGPRASIVAENGFSWSPDDVAGAEQLVFDCIDLASSRFNVSEQRIFLGGFQCGGTMALRVALRHPDKFSGMLTIGGPFPAGNSPLVRIQQARQTPLFVAYGNKSTTYPMNAVCNDLRLFHAAGMVVNVRQYPCGDDLYTQMLHDMNIWMMEQVNGQPTSPGENNLYGRLN